MKLTDEQWKEWEEACEVLMKWMAENVNPHTNVILSANSAELVEGARVHNTNKFLVD